VLPVKSPDQALNDVIARAFVSAGIPVTKKPIGLTGQEGKRPNSLTLIPWQCGRPFTWDVTVVGCYVSAAARTGGAAAAQAACQNSAKYDLLVQTGRLFQPTVAMRFHRRVWYHALSLSTRVSECQKIKRVG